MLRTVLVALIILATIGAGAVIYGRFHWSRATETLLARLDESRAPVSPIRYDEREIAHLPSPVQRYFRFALRSGQPTIAAIAMQHRGEFNLSLDNPNWITFRSRQNVSTRRPGFVWNAAMSMAPGFDVFVHDAYIAGQGILNPTILGLVDIQNLRGTGDIARGELMRFLAEAPWYPTALLPSQGVTWIAIDDTRATATFQDGGLELMLTFAFASTGPIESVRAEARGFTKGEEIFNFPWEGRWSNYAERSGMQIPLNGEVAWHMPDGRRPYWRGSITEIAYEFAQAP